MTFRQLVPWLSPSGRASTTTGQAAGTASGLRDSDPTGPLRVDTRELENRLRRGEALTRMGHFTIEVEGEGVSWSEGHNEIWGFDRHAAPSLADVVSRIHAADRPHVRAALERSRHEGVAVTFEFRLVRQDGTELTLRTLVESGQDPVTGRPVYSGTTADVTAQKEVEAALASGDERLRQAVRLGRLGIFDHDHASGQVYWSPEQRAMWGFDPAAAATLKLTIDRVHPDDRARVQLAMLRSHDPAGDGAFDVEHRVLTDDGSIRWIHARAQTYFEGAGADRHAVRTVGASADITDLKHVEIDLRIKDLALSSWASGVLLVGLDNRIAYANPAWLRMHGYDADEVLGQAPFTFVSGDTQRTRVRESLYTVGSWKGEVVSVRRDGSTFDAELTINSVTGADGSRVAFLGSIQDVTERKQAEAQVRRSEAILRSVFEASKDAIVVTKDQRVLFANRATVEMFGFNDAVELEGLPLSSRIPASELPRVMAINKAREEGRPAPASYETKGLRRDGSEFDAEISASTYTIDDRVFPLVVIRDVSARKAADRALRESAERLSKVFNSTSDAQLLYRVVEDGELLIVSANLAYRNVRQMAFPGAPTTLEGRWRHEMLADQGLNPSQIEMEMPAFRQVMATRQPVSHELEIPLPDGQVSIVEARIEPVFDPDGAVTHLLWVGRDITERRRAEEAVRQLNVELERRVVERTSQLEAANRELEAFAYSVSHDLRAPARAVDSFAGILTEDYGTQLDAEGLRLCGVVRSEAQRMGRLIDDLLTFSRLGRTAMQPGPVDMAALVVEVYEELSLDQDRSRITLRLGDLPPAFGDRPLLRQVWVNLMANALKFSAKQPVSVIDISGRTSGDPVETVYTVADNGAGFNMAYRAKLFGVFQRLHSEHEFSGTGVGLAIVQRIVHRHGGQVWAEGEVGRGAAFSFALPMPELGS